MIKYFLILMIVAFSSMSSADDNIAYVYIRANESAKTSFELWRNGRLVENISNGMGLVRGDVIKPLRNRSVNIVFINTLCKPFEIKTMTPIIGCDALSDKKNNKSSVRNIYTAYLAPLIGSPPPPIEKPTMTNRGTPQKCYCITRNVTRTTPFPGENATFFAGEPIIFCWNKANYCTKEGDLVILSNDGLVLYKKKLSLEK